MKRDFPVNPACVISGVRAVAKISVNSKQYFTNGNENNIKVKFHIAVNHNSAF
jgi:hypothetical protein